MSAHATSTTAASRPFLFSGLHYFDCFTATLGHNFRTFNGVLFGSNSLNLHQPQRDELRHKLDGGMPAALTFQPSALPFQFYK